VNDSRFGDERLGRFLERVASGAPAPGGGAVAAVAAALAAGLVAMVARLSTRQLADAAAVATEADRLWQRALVLADDDARVYQEVVAAYALPKDADHRKDRIRVALERATDVPLEVARVASEAAMAASSLLEGGNRNLKGDAVAAVLLAEAAARGAATLVELNVALGKLEGDWVDRLSAHLALAADAGRRAGTDSRDGS
jgi:methenyltetrahydrofolate cyclohydrolase